MVGRSFARQRSTRVGHSEPISDNGSLTGSFNGQLALLYYKRNPSPLPATNPA